MAFDIRHHVTAALGYGGSTRTVLRVVDEVANRGRLPRGSGISLDRMLVEIQADRDIAVRINGRNDREAVALKQGNDGGSIPSLHAITYRVATTQLAQVTLSGLI